MILLPYTNTKIPKGGIAKSLTNKNRELQSILTDFVVNEYFPTANDTEQFIKIVYDTFDNGIKQYRNQNSIAGNDIFFVYKGGNILRYVVYQLMHEIGGQVSDDIEKYYKDVFKKSDADFSIYVNPKMKNYDVIFRDMNLLAYKLQDNIRKEFTNNPSKYFNFYRLNNEIKKNILKQYLKKLNETETIKNKMHGYDGVFVALVLDDISVSVGNKNITYVREPDYATEYDPHDKTIINEIKLRTSPEMTNMRITSNQTTEVIKNKTVSKFSLVRTKVIFNAYFANSVTKNVQAIMLGGELIDVSLPHKDDSNMGHYFEHLDKNIQTYHVNNLTFKAPSITYLVEDIEKILFLYSDYPWNDNKYMKRLKRLIFMYFFQLLINKDLDYNAKVRYLKYIKDNIFGKINERVINVKSIDEFLLKCNSNFPFCVLLRNLKKLLGEPVDAMKFNEYCKTVSDNIEILLKLFDEIMQRYDMTGVSVNRITEGNILWGGDNYKMKYFKYKKKYLQLKSNKN